MAIVALTYVALALLALTGGVLSLSLVTMLGLSFVHASVGAGSRQVVPRYLLSALRMVEEVRSTIGPQARASVDRAFFEGAGLWIGVMVSMAAVGLVGLLGGASWLLVWWLGLSAA